MSHQLDIRNGQASLWLNGEPAWHQLGQVRESWTSLDEVLTDAGLDWEVEKRPLFWGQYPESKMGMDKLDVGQNWATVRINPDGSEIGLGTVGRIYLPFQNREAFKFLQDVTEQGEMWFRTAGMLSRGSLVFISMELGAELVIDPEGIADAVKKYVTFTNRHDGKGKITAHVSPTRVVCANTLDWSLQGATSFWSAVHSLGARDKVEEARRELKLANAYYDKFKADADDLFKTSMSNDEFQRFLAEVVFPAAETDSERIKKQAVADREAVTELYLASKTTDGVRGTRWGAAQAFTEFVDHRQAVRVPKSLRVDTALPQTIREQMARGARLIEAKDADRKSKVHSALLTWGR